MQIRRTFLLLSMLFIGFQDSYGQAFVNFRAEEDTLKSLSEKVWKSKDDSSRLAQNKLFSNRLQRILSVPGAYAYPFDSLSGISRQSPDNRSFRLITWNLPLQNGRFLYFGFVEKPDGKLYPIESHPVEPGSFNSRLIPYSEWYGALYYKVIRTKYKKSEYYTLLGWEGNDESSNRKIIDIISFNAEGAPVFGKAIFKTPDGVQSRFVLEYAEKSNALVRYDLQGLMVKKWGRVVEKKRRMIIMDHLIPMTPNLKGIQKYYVPSGETYDAFLFDEGYWKYVEEVNAVNNIRK